MVQLGGSLAGNDSSDDSSTCSSSEVGLSSLPGAFMTLPNIAARASGDRVSPS